MRTDYVESLDRVMSTNKMVITFNFEIKVPVFTTVSFAKDLYLSEDIY